MTTGEQLIVELRAALEQLIGDLQSVTEDYTAAQKGLAQMESALAVEKAAREKAEAVANEPCANCGFPTEDVIGQPKVTERLAAAQKRIETLEGAAGRLLAQIDVVHRSEEYKAVWVGNQVRFGPYRGPSYDLTELRAALASPSESAPPKDQGAGAAPPAAPREPVTEQERQSLCVWLEHWGKDGVPNWMDPAGLSVPCSKFVLRRLLDALAQPPAPQRHPSAPNPETFFRQAVALLPKVAGSLTADQKCGVISDALGRAYADGWNACLAAQPPAPQEGLFEKGFQAAREAAIAVVRAVEDQAADEEHVVNMADEMERRIRALPLPAEPSAPQAVDAPQVGCPWTEETMLIINRLTPDIKGKAFDPEWFLLRQRFEQFEAAAQAIPSPAPPAPVSAPQDNENRLSGKGK